MRVHKTGDGLPSLDGIRAIVMWLADPLRDTSLSCYEEALAIADMARERGVRVINPPEALSKTRKSIQAELWHAASVPTAIVRRFEDAIGYREAVASTPFPLIVRPDSQHSQDNMAFFSSLPELDEFAPPPQGAVAAFVDTRWLSAPEDSIWRSLWHKKRVMVCGDMVWNNHTFFSKSPIVGLKSSTLMRPQQANQTPRARLTRKNAEADRRYWEGRVAQEPSSALDFAQWEESVAEDVRFFDSSPEEPELMRRALRALGLDWAAIDYSTTVAGDVVLWEANPYFYLHRPGNSVLRRERDLDRRLRLHRERMRAFLASLLEA